MEQGNRKKLSKFGRRTFLALLAALTAEACLPEDVSACNVFERRRRRRRSDSESWVRKFPNIGKWLKEIDKECRSESKKCYSEEAFREMTLNRADTYLRCLYPHLRFDVSKLQNKKGMVSYRQLRRDLGKDQIKKMKELESLVGKAYQNNKPRILIDRYRYSDLREWVGKIFTMEAGWMLLEKMPIEEKEAGILASGKGENKKGRGKEIKIELDLEELQKRTDAQMTQDIEAIFGKGMPAFVDRKGNSLYLYKLDEFYGKRNLTFKDKIYRAKYEKELNRRETEIRIRGAMKSMPRMPMPRINPDIDRPKEMLRV